MPWTCPDCRQQFATTGAAHGHECKGFPELLIAGERPRGGPGNDHDPALSQALPVADAVLHAFNLVLMATGVRDGFESTIDPRALHRAIRVYRPEDMFAHVGNGKSNRIMPQDEWMHAGRIAQRLLTQSLGTRLKLAGNWRSAKEVRARLDALYALTRSLAEEHSLDLSKWKTLG